MATETKLPVTKSSGAPAAAGEAWRPFQREGGLRA